MVNRGHYFGTIGWDEDHYFPRCQSGQSSCNIAAPLGEMSFRLRPTLEYLGTVNTSLDQALDELDAVRKSYVQLSRENAELRRQLGGPHPEAPHTTFESPPRNRGGHGDAHTSICGPLGGFTLM